MQTQNQYAPCPKCGQSNAQPVKYTWWGGAIGPKMMSHVKCQNCSTQYNGKTGKSNTQSIIIYNIVLFAISFCVCGGLAAVNVFMQNQ
jgi:hypothetical protein